MRIKDDLEGKKAGYKNLGVFYKDKLVSLASTSAPSEISAMVVGVASEASFRNRGLASAAVSKLVKDELSSGKRYLCLFYDNPSAGRIYKKIGFKEDGLYAMLK